MYSIHNEGKSIVAERCIRTLKTKMYKYMTSISKNVYIDKLDDIVGEQNNTCHRTNVASLKAEVDKLDIDKLVSVPVDLSKLSDVVKNGVVKKTEMMNQLLKQIILILAGLF